MLFTLWFKLILSAQKQPGFSLAKKDDSAFSFLDYLFLEPVPEK